MVKVGLHELDQQAFLFAYGPNLRRMAWELNSARGIKQYKSLARVKWEKYVKDFGALERLDELTLQMRERITNLINNPRNPELWRRFGFRPKGVQVLAPRRRPTHRACSIAART